MINVEAGSDMPRIGYETENNRTIVRFDISDIMTEFPGGYAALILHRPSDNAKIVSTSTVMDGTDLVWTVRDCEIQKKGYLRAQIIYTVDNVVAKTKIYRFIVSESLMNTSESPNGWEDWVNELLSAAYQVQTEISEAEETINDAVEQAQQAAVDAESVVIIQDEQPEIEANKVWIDSDSVQDTLVPTMDEFNEVKGSVNTLKGGTSGQLLKKKSDSDFDVEWSDIGTPSHEQVESAVENWLDDHPEATTTVEDGAITKVKLSSDLKSEIETNTTDVEELNQDILLKVSYPTPPKSKYGKIGQVLQTRGDGSTEWVDQLALIEDGAITEDKLSPEVKGEIEDLQEAVEKLNEMEATATQLSSRSVPTAEIDHSGEIAILRIGIPKGETGEPGQPGVPGQNGVSPVVTVTDITGGHRVTITDATHPSGQSFDVMDGTGGSGGGVTPEDLEEALAPIEDDIDGLDERVSVLESEPIGPGGISVALRAALLQLAEKVAYVDNSGPDCYQDLYNALYNGGQIVSIDSISAVLNLEGHSVMAGDSVETLRPYLTVTATYSDDSVRTITNYTLSGTISAGTNTITVAYEGETDTFTVVGGTPSVLPTGYTEIPSLYCGGGENVYLRTGVMSGDIDSAEYRIMPMDLRYLKAGHVVCATNHYFPYLTGDNANGEHSRIGFKNRGNDDASVSSGSYVFPWNFNERHTLMGFVDGKVYVDGNELFTIPAGSAASSEIVVFAAPDANRYFIGRLYWLKFYKNGEVYRNYIPCKNSNDTPGLYETVTGTFLYDENNTNMIRVGGD